MCCRNWCADGRNVRVRQGVYPMKPYGNNLRVPRARAWCAFSRDTLIFRTCRAAVHTDTTHVSSSHQRLNLTLGTHVWDEHKKYKKFVLREFKHQKYNVWDSNPGPPVCETGVITNYTNIAYNPNLIMNNLTPYCCIYNRVPGNYPRSALVKR